MPFLLVLFLPKHITWGQNKQSKAAGGDVNNVEKLVRTSPHNLAGLFQAFAGWGALLIENRIQNLLQLIRMLTTIIIIHEVGKKSF